jgi:LuxR family maltose regulon positive regulatory protein
VAARSGSVHKGSRRPRQHPASRGADEVRSRFRPPPPHLELVERPALLERLAATTEPLVLVCAPAGAGKTMALCQWAAKDARPVVWVRLEPADDDPVVLLMGLARALGTVADVDPGVGSALGLSVPPVRELVLPLLADALAEAEPFLMVLDDAQSIAGCQAWDVVGFILRSLPPGAQVAIGTRVDPGMPLARLRAAGELAEIRLADLTFDESEAAELVALHACGDPDLATVRQLLRVTEGWAAGLHLACVASCQRPLNEWLPELDGSHGEIASYLSSEVLERQPPDVQEFLLTTSVLCRLTPASCMAVTGRDDAGELLQRVAREELFLVPIGDDGLSYRYHHLFAEAIAAELERRHPGRARRLHRVAGSWCADQGDLDGAVSHYIAGRHVDVAADIVAASWTAMWDKGKAETVRRWLLLFDDRQILSHKSLLLTAGWVFTALDAGEFGTRWGRAACDALMTDAPSPDGASSLRSSQALLRATVALDGVRRMREDAELAATLESTPGSSWHADAQVALGVARWLSGSTQRALHPLALAAREGSIYNPSAELAALGYLSLIAVEEHEWTAAEEYEARASARLTELGFGTSRRCLPMLLARVALLARDPHGDVESAVADVHRLLEHMVPHPWMALMTHGVLGEVALARSDLIEAAAHAAAAAALLRHYPDAGIIGRHLDHLRQGVEMARVAEPLTVAEHKVLDLLTTHFTEAQIAEHLFISRNTVKTHVRSVYRKLGTSTRADAVQRARDIGMLPLD